jgi:hypothetical protein
MSFYPFISRQIHWSPLERCVLVVSGTSTCQNQPPTGISTTTPNEHSSKALQLLECSPSHCAPRVRMKTRPTYISTMNDSCQAHCVGELISVSGTLIHRLITKYSGIFVQHSSNVWSPVLKAISMKMAGCLLGHCAMYAREYWPTFQMLSPQGRRQEAPLQRRSICTGLNGATFHKTEERSISNTH